MLSRLVLISSSLLLVCSAAQAEPSTAPAKASTVNANVISTNCEGEYCQLTFMVDKTTKQAICGDETYCEQWVNAQQIPADLKAKTAKITIESMLLEDLDANADVITKIEF